MSGLYLPVSHASPVDNVHSSLRLVLVQLITCSSLCVVPVQLIMHVLHCVLCVASHPLSSVDLAILGYPTHTYAASHSDGTILLCFTYFFVCCKRRKANLGRKCIKCHSRMPKLLLIDRFAKVRPPYCLILLRHLMYVYYVLHAASFPYMVCILPYCLLLQWHQSYYVLPSCLVPGDYQSADITPTRAGRSLYLVSREPHTPHAYYC